MDHVWWRYHAGDAFGEIYHWFNLAEGAIWMALAALVAARFVRYRRSPIELMYAASYFTFGVTDFIESQLVPTWLIALKAINLAAILTLRRFVLKHYYPTSQIF